jgi:hypothetical protein
MQNKMLKRRKVSFLRWVPRAARAAAPQRGPAPARSDFVFPSRRLFVLFCI